ncbi:unnamed protein product [Lampetra fluviatilis]
MQLTLGATGQRAGWIFLDAVREAERKRRRTAKVGGDHVGIFDEGGSAWPPPPPVREDRDHRSPMIGDRPRSVAETQQPVSDGKSARKRRAAGPCTQSDCDGVSLPEAPRVPRERAKCPHGAPVACFKTADHGWGGGGYSRRGSSIPASALSRAARHAAGWALANADTTEDPFTLDGRLAAAPGSERSQPRRGASAVRGRGRATIRVKFAAVANERGARREAAAPHVARGPATDVGCCAARRRPRFASTPPPLLLLLLPGGDGSARGLWSSTAEAMRRAGGSHKETRALRSASSAAFADRRRVHAHAEESRARGRLRVDRDSSSLEPSGAARLGVGPLL